MQKIKIVVLTAQVIKLVKRHHEPPVLPLYFGGFPGWLAWFLLQFFFLNNKIHFFLANANISASFKRKMVEKSWFLLIQKQETNLWMKLPTIRPGLAGKNVKKRPLSEPVRLQDSENSARSLTKKKKMSLFMVRVMFRKLKRLAIILSCCSHFARVFNSRFLAFPK